MRIVVLLAILLCSCTTTDEPPPKPVRVPVCNVLVDMVCDGVVDCEDGSDEFGCDEVA